MANNRVFSDTIKLEVIKENLRKNKGSICCEICGNKLDSIEQCHFDHIYPYAKGGQSTLENCQILCSKCNLSKNDKELRDFVLEEKAKRFLTGKSIVDGVNDESNAKQIDSCCERTGEKTQKLSKADFDTIIKQFIERKGDIHKVDFTRAYNNLPSVWYVREYYGDLNSLKKAFGIEDVSLNWSRDRIKQTLLEFVSIHGDVRESDLKKKNGLPSYPCVLKYFPEYNSLTKFKQEELGITDVYKVWTRDEIIEAGKAYVKKYGYITEKDLKKKNGLPTSKVIYNHFGDMNTFQRLLGAPVKDKNQFVSKDEIEAAVDEFFGLKERIVESRKEFFSKFPYKEQIIYKRYGSIDNFCIATGIVFKKVKKAAYSKQDVDDAVHKWVFDGNEIPKAKDLAKYGLPSLSTIMKFYENWREPFILYQKIYNEANRHKV